MQDCGEPASGREGASSLMETRMDEKSIASGVAVSVVIGVATDHLALGTPLGVALVAVFAGSQRLRA